MFEQLSQAMSSRVKFPLAIKSMILLALVAALSSSAFAQTQTSTDMNTEVTTMVATAKAEPPVALPSADRPFTSTNKPGKAPIGAGSSHQGYVMARGYFFSVDRSDGNPALITASGGGAVASVVDFDYGWKSAYKVEVGWNWASGWGLRTSYFYTNQSAQENRNGTVGAPFIISPRPLNVTFTGAADAGTLARFRERFQIHVIDVEGDYKWKDPSWSVLVSGGIRIAAHRQTYTAEDTFAGTTELVTYVQERTGYGPTAAIDFRHKLGGSGLWWTGSGRVAALWGTIDENASYVVPGFSQVAARAAKRTTWVFEGETGLEWSTGCCGGSEFFINGSVMYHHWNDLVNIIPVPAVGASATTSLDNPLVAATRKGSIAFIGGVFTVGFRF